MIIPVILAGGSGTRLWPLSRELYPKQLINLVDDKTLLQKTVLRFKGYNDIEPPMIVCNDEHRFMVAEQLREINVNPDTIILEPIPKNTAPALAAAAALIALSRNIDPLLLILPADHSIEDIEAFHNSLKLAKHYASQDYLITFGIIPNRPETGYGYIKTGDCPQNKEKTFFQNKAYFIEKFVEKPDLNQAKLYVDSKEYLWNSGMFMMSASCAIEELSKYAPEIVNACKKSVNAGINDLDFFRLDKNSFNESPIDSIDYAIMEKTDKGIVVSLDAGWNDLGSWDALWETGKKDKNNNVIKGDVLTYDVQGSFLHSTSRLIAAVGLSEHIVVETSDAVLISPKNKVQDVKILVNILKSRKREEAISHKKVYRPWGSYESIVSSENFKVKRIIVKPGAKLSLQKHFHRSEHWIVVKGTAIVRNGDKEFLLREDESTYIRLGYEHRLENPGKIPLELIEVQTGRYLEEDDIVRFEDVYGRGN
ncbi:MAG: mannose-1-phosphate guanylyltransferase/mannose-6-phosphate isomerase [Desulfobacterales bacterium]|nr:mannose-1-phosphate guanylyltransferase/mannose-6-phosphate isomerase [Desulfobacterales bacterium]